MEGELEIFQGKKSRESESIA